MTMTPMTPAPQPKPRSDFRNLVLKTLIALCAPLIIFTMIGCVPEEPDLKDYGPQKSEAEIGSEVVAALGPLDFAGVEKGEFVVREVWADIQGQNSVPQSANSIEVLSKTETNETVEYEFVYTTVAIDQNGNPGTPNAREFPFRLCKIEDCNTPTVQTQSSTATITPKVRPLELWRMAGGDSTKEPVFQEDRPTYHNLKVRKMTIEPPKAVRDHANCRGLSPCQINVTVINYDVVFRDEKNDAHVYEVQFITSSDLPFLARYKIYLTETGELAAARTPLSFCRTYAVGVTPVTVCEDVSDFIVGQIDTQN